MASDEVKRSRATPWFGTIMGIVFLLFLTPLPGWVMSFFDPPPLRGISPSSVCSAVLGTKADAHDAGLIAVLEEKQKLVILNQMQEKIQLLLDEPIDWFRFSSDGSMLAIRTEDSIQLWDVKGWTILRSYAIDHRPETTSCVGAAGVITAGADSSEFSQLTLRHYGLNDSHDVRANLPERRSWKLSLEAEGKVLVAQAVNLVILIDPKSGRVLDEIKMSGNIGRIAVSPDLRYVAREQQYPLLWVDMGRLNVWDREDKRDYPLSGRGRGMHLYGFTQNGYLLVQDGPRVSVWNPRSKNYEAELLHSENMRPIPDRANVVAVSDQSPIVYTWKLDRL